MSLMNLDNLAKTNLLKNEPFNQSEFEGLFKSGQTRFKDAQNTTLALESRFDLAYNAAHSLALAALRLKNFRSSNRYIVFQVLPITLGLGPEIWRVFAKAHELRNVSEYEGYFEIDNQLLLDLLTSTQILLERLITKKNQKTS